MHGVAICAVAASTRLVAVAVDVGGECWRADENALPTYAQTVHSTVQQLHVTVPSVSATRVPCARLRRNLHWRQSEVNGLHGRCDGWYCVAVKRCEWLLLERTNDKVLAEVNGVTILALNRKKTRKRVKLCTKALICVILLFSENFTHPFVVDEHFFKCQKVAESEKHLEHFAVQLLFALPGKMHEN